MKLRNLIFVFTFLMLFASSGNGQIYVSPDLALGSDSNTGLSPTDPLATITHHALTLIDPSIGGTIRLMPGEFYEQVFIDGYENLIIEPEGSGEVILHGSYKDLALDNFAWNWEVVETSGPNADFYIQQDYVGNNIIYKADIPAPPTNNTTNPLDYIFNWMFRKLGNGETEQIYGYFDLNKFRDRNDKVESS